jgi:CBS domain-containing membrane protein
LLKRMRSLTKFLRVRLAKNAPLSPPVRARFSRVALLNLANGGLSMAVMASLAAVTHTVFIFPSLGPTAFLFFTMPMSASASPRNTVIGHAIGVVVGYCSLVLTGLAQAGPALALGVTGPRILAVGLAFAATSYLMVVLRAHHAPATATALLIALGILPHPRQLVVVMLAVLLLTLQAYVFNHLLGIPYPRWRPMHNSVPPASRMSLVAQYKMSKKYSTSKMPAIPRQKRHLK